ncbi:barstar family protein [Streptosporangium sp. NPDC051022]|uniref:barstar family protein n=1 Tax=Streptosporangium sp. NPDC051022 TaxID=3155752 RepID=UPI00343ECB13
MPRGTFEEGPHAGETLRALEATAGAGGATGATGTAGVSGGTTPGEGTRSAELSETVLGAAKAEDAPETTEAVRVVGAAGTTAAAETGGAPRSGTFVHRIDGSEITTSAEAMSAIAAALSFPDYFGHNLDALYDCLTDLAWLPAGEHVLVWSRSGILRTTDRAAYEAIRTVLTDAVADDTAGEAFLSVLLPGE